MCLVGKKGADPVGYQRNAGSDIIFAPRCVPSAAPRSRAAPRGLQQVDTQQSAARDSKAGLICCEAVKVQA